MALLRGQVWSIVRRWEGGSRLLMAKEDLVAIRPTWMGELGRLYYGKKAVVAKVRRPWKMLEIDWYLGRKEGGRDC